MHPKSLCTLIPAIKFESGGSIPTQYPRYCMEWCKVHFVRTPAYGVLITLFFDLVAIAFLVFIKKARSTWKPSFRRRQNRSLLSVTLGTVAAVPTLTPIRT